MDAGPGGSVARERAVIVAAGVVHVPMQETRIETLLAEPIGKRDAIQVLKLRGEPELKRDGKRSALPKIIENIFKALKLIAVCLFKAHGRLDAFLPAAVEKQTLLRRKSEITFFPSAILENTEIFEEFADVFGLRAGYRNVMRGPRVDGDFVFAPAGVAAGLGVHFQKNKIAEAALAKTPSGAESADSAANNDHREFFIALRGWKRGTVAQEMANLKRIVEERELDIAFAFEGKTNERGAAETEKLAAAELQ